MFMYYLAIIKPHATQIGTIFVGLFSSANGDNEKKTEQIITMERTPDKIEDEALTIAYPSDNKDIPFLCCS